MVSYERQNENESKTNITKAFMQTLIMENKRRNAYDVAFKLKAVNLSVKEGNRAAARGLGINDETLETPAGRTVSMQEVKKSFQR